MGIVGGADIARPWVGLGRLTVDAMRGGSDMIHPRAKGSLTPAGGHGGGEDGYDEGCGLTCTDEEGYEEGYKTSLTSGAEGYEEGCGRNSEDCDLSRYMKFGRVVGALDGDVFWRPV